jgi:hypothetical protein
MRVALSDPRPQIGMRENGEPLFKNWNRLVRYDHFGNLKSLAAYVSRLGRISLMKRL